MLYIVVLPIGYQIYLRRLDRDLTQSELAQKVGIPQPNLSNIEKGKQDLTVSTLRRIAVALDTPPAEFFEPTKSDVKSKLNRTTIESIAKTVAGKDVVSERGGSEVRLFQNVLPYKGRVRVKELRKSWLELRKRFNPQEIASVCERVAEYKRRKS